MSVPKKLKMDRAGLDDLDFGSPPPKDMDRLSRKLLRFRLSLGVLLIAFASYIEGRALGLLKINGNLPERLTIFDRLGDGGLLWRRLLKLGAFSKDGKVYDKSGREIFFRYNVVPGVEPGKDQLLYMRKQRKEQEQKYTVIDLPSIEMP